MGFLDFFSNQTETSENHKRDAFKTRYYKTSKQQMIRALKDMLHADSRIDLVDISEERGEIIAQFNKPKKAFLVISVIMVFPQRTAVDFTLTTNTKLLPIDGGFSRREVLKLYQKLDKQFQFSGVGLAKG